MIYLGWSPRRGKCQKCNKKIGDGYFSNRDKNRNELDHLRLVFLKRTEMHHYFYLVIMPWACCIEVCQVCHVNIDGRINNIK